MTPARFVFPTSRFISALAFVAWVALMSTRGYAQDASQSDNAGLDLFKPTPNLFQTMFGYRTAPGSTREVTTETLGLRLDHSVELAPLWTLALRTDLPFVAKNPINATNPAGDFLYGAGDADFQAVAIRAVDQRWTFGFGGRLITPTGGDTLGSGKWQIMPIGGFRYALPEVNSSTYLEPIVRYDVSFAGDPAKRNISNLQFAPMFNLGLPDRWFVTFYPSADIRWNFGDRVTGQTGRLFLPLDVRVGRKVADNVVLSLEVAAPIVRDYPVYNFKTQVRLNLTY